MKAFTRNTYIDLKYADYHIFPDRTLSCAKSFLQDFLKIYFQVDRFLLTKVYLQKDVEAARETTIFQLNFEVYSVSLGYLRNP